MHLKGFVYKDGKFLAKDLQILLSRTQAGPGRGVKKEQEKNSRNHLQALFAISVYDKQLLRERYQDTRYIRILA